MTISMLCKTIFSISICDFHKKNETQPHIENPYPVNTLENLLYHKCWIDLVQWHMEDEIRSPSIDPVIGMEWKRRIDSSNQDRTNIVEHIDEYFNSIYNSVIPKKMRKSIQKA